MSHVHGINGLQCRSLLQEGIDRLLMQTGFKKVSELRKDLINIGRKLNFQSSPLFDGFLIEAPHGLKIHKIKVIEGIKPVRNLHHKCFSNDVCVDLICLRFVNAIPSHSRSLDGVQHTPGKFQRQGIKQGCHHSVPLIQDR